MVFYAYILHTHWSCENNTEIQDTHLRYMAFWTVSGVGVGGHMTVGGLVSGPVGPDLTRN